MSQNKIEKWDEVQGNKTPDERMAAFLDNANNAYALLQFKHTEETEQMRFMPYRYVQMQEADLSIDHYELVYHGQLEQSLPAEIQLEQLYMKFNTDHPEDFKGHSMSVSDIVALKAAGEVSCYYVDAVGFVELPGFIQPENYLRNAEMGLEDDYGMSDGIINNGKSAQREDINKSSVLEQLKISLEKEVFKKPSHRPSERDLE